MGASWSRRWRWRLVVDELAARRAVGSKADLIKQVEAMNRVIENMATQHVTWEDMDGNTWHPDWCRECRVSVLLALLWKVMTDKSGGLQRRVDDRTATD